MTPQEEQAEIRRLSAELRRLKQQLRSGLTPEQQAEALRIGRISFKSAGATRRTPYELDGDGAGDNFEDR